MMERIKLMMHRGTERTSYIPFPLNSETRSDVIPVRIVQKVPLPLQVYVYVLSKYLLLFLFSSFYLWLVKILLMEGKGSLFDIVAPFLEGGGRGNPGVQPPAPSDPTPTLVPVVPETGMPQDAPGHEILPPVPPEIPRLEPPLITDRQRFIELQERFHIYYLGRNEISNLAEFAGRLERAVPIERNIEAALVFDGYHPDRIRLRINEIRGILFTHPTRVLLLSEHTLDGYLNEIQTNGTRQSVPYLRVVRAIRNSNLLL